MLVPDWGDMIGLSLDNLIGLGFGQQAPRQRCVLGPEDARNCYQFQQQMNALAALAGRAGRSDQARNQSGAHSERHRISSAQAQQANPLARLASATDRGPATTRQNTPKPDPLKVAAEQELKEYLGVEDLYDPNDPWVST